jgi:two-component system, NarL family, nitrate/nitrite response regulator NarL
MLRPDHRLGERSQVRLGALTPPTPDSQAPCHHAGMDRLRVWIVGEDPLARAGLVAIVAGRHRLVVAGESSAASFPAEAGDADVVLWDLGPGSPDPWRPGEGGLPWPVVVVIDDPQRVAEALGAGARGILSREAEPGRLAAALHAAAAGLVVVDESFVPALAPARPRGELAEPLTPREQEVLGLLAEGLSNRRIAGQLGISEHTAKFHVNAILGKLGAQSRSEAIVQGARLGLIVL